jgi:formate dehydrogenase major subunit
MGSSPVIDFISSEGLEADLIYDGTNFYHVVPRTGLVNNGTIIPPCLERCIPYLNDSARITRPLKKSGAGFVEISFSEAFDIIETAIKRVNPDENAFFVGARLSNEAMYLIQKLARAGVKSNNIGSFHYLGRNATHYNIDKNDNVQFSEIENCTSVALLALKEVSELVWYTMNNKIPSCGTNDNNCDKQAAETAAALSPPLLPPPLLTHTSSFRPQGGISTKNYYHLIKALNHHIVANNLQRGIFVETIVKEQFPKYKEQILAEDFELLLEKAGVSASDLSDFTTFYVQEKQCVIVYSEQDISSHTVRELLNLCLLTGKSGFPSSGILSIKEKNNAQGLFDMGIFSHLGTGGKMFTDSFVETLKNTWKVAHVATEPIDNEEYLYSGKSKNLFIFGEDPLGCLKSSVSHHCDCEDTKQEAIQTLETVRAQDRKTGRSFSQLSALNSQLPKSQFIMVQDYFLTATALKADLILPDTFPFETGGSFTNTIKIVQSFSKTLPSPIELDHLQQLSALCQRLGLSSCDTLDDIFLELVSFFKAECSGGSRHQLVYTEKDSNMSLFVAGCDDLMRKCLR